MWNNTAFNETGYRVERKLAAQDDTHWAAVAGAATAADVSHATVALAAADVAKAWDWRVFAMNGTLKSANPSNTVTQSGIALKQVAFGGQEILRDNGTGAYAGAQWYDPDLNGIVNNSTWLDKTLDNAAGDHVYPVSYFRSTPGSDRFISATPTLAYTGSTEADWKIRGISSGLSGTIFGGTFNAGTGTITGNTTAGAALPTTIASEELEITWEVSPDNGGTWIEAGKSKNHLFVTGVDTTPYTNMFETVIYLGCEGAKGKRPANPDEKAATIGSTLNNFGKTQDGLVADSIWSRFGIGNDGGPANPHNVANVALKYWGALTDETHENVPEFGTTSGLLKNADGRCGGWASFMISVLAGQGLLGVDQAIVADPNTPLDAESLPSGATVQSKAFDVGAGTAAQGNATPWHVFPDHAVVRIPGINTIFDPSYGRRFDGVTMGAAKAAWEDSSVSKIRWFYVMPGPPYHYSLGSTFTSHTAGIAQVLFP